MSKTDHTEASMTPAERAKQFMPFAALKGYEEALRKVEREHEERMTRPAWVTDAAENSSADSNGKSEADLNGDFEGDLEIKSIDLNQK